MVGIALDIGQGAERRPVPDHDELPRLFVGGAPRETGDLEYVIDDLLRHGVLTELPHRPQREQKRDQIRG